MIIYELNLLYKIMPREELFSALKRTAEYIFATGGFLRKIENYGEKELPYKIRSHENTHKRANFFMMEITAPINKLEGVVRDLNRDIDIIRPNLIKQTTPEEFTCTFGDEMKPAPYRPDVQNLMKTKFTRGQKFVAKFNPYSGLDYYPFQR